MTDQIPHKFGLLAGEGDAPLIVAKEAVAEGHEIIAFGFKKITSPEIENYASKVIWIDFGHFEEILDLFRQNNLQHVIMIGRINHRLVFSLSLFDKWTRNILKSLALKDARSIKNIIFDFFAQENISVLDSSIFLKECLPKPGMITSQRGLTEQEQQNIDFGYPIARQIASLEVGQTIAVKDGIVIAVEGIEGTNRLIERAGELSNGGCTIIKASRPQQDKRFDLPVVGLKTLEKMNKNKCTAIALTAGETIFLEQKETIAFAEKNNIVIVSVDPAKYK